MNTATQPEQPTPGPWHVRLGTDNIWIEAKALGSRFVCDMEADESDNIKERAQIHADAAFIVLACNAHAELVDAAKEARDIANCWNEEEGERCGCRPCKSTRRLQAAIAKATPEC